MKSSKEAIRDAKKLFSVSFDDGKLDLSMVKKVVDKLADSKPRGYLSVIDAYWKLVRLEVEKNQARIESASELEPAMKEKVVADLQKKYGDQIEAEFTMNPELIGGMRIKVGSDVWDGSVKNRIERLDEKF